MDLEQLGDARSKSVQVFGREVGSKLDLLMSVEQRRLQEEQKRTTVVMVTIAGLVALAAAIAAGELLIV